MDNTLLSTISVMNFNNINSTRSLARKAYGPSTDFLFNNFKAGRSYSDYIDYNAEQQVNDFLDRYNDSAGALKDVSSDLKRLYLDAHKSKDTRLDSDTLTAIASNQAEINTYQITVDQLATTQIDTSTDYDADSEDLSAYGDIHLTIEQDGETHEIEVTTENGDSNQDVLKNLATALNDSDAAIKATVLTDSDNNVRLSVESKDTGETSAFNLSGGFSEFINVNTLSSAKNAAYTVDESNFESETNTIALDNGQLEVTFNKESTGPETLAVTLDEDPITDQLSALAERLQDISTFLSDYGDDSRLLGKYDRRLDHILKANQGTLNKIGIEKDAEGNISFNEEKFTQAFETAGDLILKELDTAGGFNDQLEKFSSDLNNQSIQTLIPDNPNSVLPRFNGDDFITYLSYSNSFNIHAFYPTGTILDFNL